jgi:superfamily II DNA or RNA helicase
MELRNYQKQIIKKVTDHLNYEQRCCVSLATGGGKTVIFSKIVESLKGRVLICVHREELVIQTSRTLELPHDLLIPKTKKLSEDITVAMVQTLHSRMKKNQVDISSYDYIIVDECHRGEFMKILDKFTGKVIGFTATPNYEKTRYFYKCLACGSEYDKSQDCCKKKPKKYREKVPLQRYYHHLIEGVGINELIEKEFLVPDENFILDVDTSILVWDEMRNDYTEESIGLVFGSDKAIKNTIEVYNAHARDKKTILFNPNTLVNKKLHKAMIEDGINAKMYDSNNSNENRHDLVKWFSDTPDAVLLNVQVFTTGFDCTDVEVVFLNKKTQSINLFLQMVGRGGRITDKIFKPSFRVIDLGGNVSEFGKWSSPRDWKPYFYAHEIKPCGSPQPAVVRDCDSCGAIVAANSIYCPECGEERKYKGGVVGLPKLNGKPIIPTPAKIIDYCEKNNLETLEARKIVYDYAARMFEDISFETYLKHKKSGNLFIKAKSKFTAYYFAIQRSKLTGNRVRTLDSFINEILKNIERRYITSGNLQMV